MKTLIRLASILCFAAIIIPALMLWSGTGRHVFTALPSAALETMARQEGSLTGLFEETPAQPPIDNAFALGLVPGGIGPDSASVVTFGVPAMFLLLAAFIRRKSPR